MFAGGWERRVGATVGRAGGGAEAPQRVETGGKKGSKVSLARAAQALLICLQEQTVGQGCPVTARGDLRPHDRREQTRTLESDTTPCQMGVRAGDGPWASGYGSGEY